MRRFWMPGRSKLEPEIAWSHSSRQPASPVARHARDKGGADPRSKHRAGFRRNSGRRARQRIIKVTPQAAASVDDGRLSFTAFSNIGSGSLAAPGIEPMGSNSETWTITHHPDSTAPDCTVDRSVIVGGTPGLRPSAFGLRPFRSHGDPPSSSRRPVLRLDRAYLPRWQTPRFYSLHRRFSSIPYSEL